MLTVEQMKETLLDYFIGPDAAPKYPIDYEDLGIDLEPGEFPTFGDLWGEVISEDLYGEGIVLKDGTAAKQVEQTGGEGRGDEYSIVFSVGPQLFRMDGYYSSWNGTNWEDAEPYEVEPVEVTVIKYKRKKN